MGWKEDIFGNGKPRREPATSLTGGWKADIQKKLNGGDVSSTTPAPNPHISQVDVGGGETIPVFSIKAPSGWTIGGRPAGISRKSPPKWGLGASAKAIALSTATIDPQAKLRIFANTRKEPEENFRVLPDGDVVRKAPEDGIWYREIPATPNAAMTEFGARTLKDAPATVAEGAALTLGPIGIPLAAGIEYGAEVGERAVARKFMGEKGSKIEAYGVRPAIRAATTTVTAPLAMIGGKTAVVGGNKAARVVRRTGQVGEIIGNKEPVARAAIRSRAANLKRFEYTKAGTARVAQSRRLGAYQQYLGAQASPAGERVAVGEAALEAQIPEALTKGKGGLPRTLPESQMDRAGMQLKKAGEGVKGNLYRHRKSRTQPMFKEADQQARAATGGKIDVTESLKYVDGKIQSAVTREERSLWEGVRADFYKKDKSGKMILQDDISQLDKLHKTFRSRSERKGEDIWSDKQTKDAMMELRNTIVDDISKVAPKYREALDLYGRLSQGIKRFEGDTAKTILKKAADAAPDQYADVVRTLFSESTSPRTIRNIKARVLKQGGGGQERWDRITEAAASDILQSLPKNLAISPNKMEVLKAALSPRQMEAFTSLQSALKDISFIPVGRVVSPGAGAGAELAKETTGGVMGRAIQRLTFSPYIQGGAVSKNRIRKYSDQIARELTTPEGISRLLRLSQLDSVWEKRATLAAYLGLQGVGANVIEQKTQ